MQTRARRSRDIHVPDCPCYDSAPIRHFRLQCLEAAPATSVQIYRLATCSTRTIIVLKFIPRFIAYYAIRKIFDNFFSIYPKFNMKIDFDHILKCDLNLLKVTSTLRNIFPGESIRFKFIPSQSELFRFIPISISEPMRIIANQSEKCFVSHLMKKVKNPSD